MSSDYRKYLFFNNVKDGLNKLNGYKPLSEIQLSFKELENSSGRPYGVSLNSIITMDIETTNGYAYPTEDENVYIVKPFIHYNPLIETNPNTGEPVSTVYQVQLAIEDVYGEIWYTTVRTYEQWALMLICLDWHIKEEAGFWDNVNANIYIHNAGFEFEFMRNICNMTEVFARKQHKPMKFKINSVNAKQFNKLYPNYTLETNLMVRDTHTLTQKSLMSWTRDLPVSKIEEPDSYYEKFRTPNTPLTEEEVAYGSSDVVSMVYGLREYRNKYDNDLKNIPLTQTGTVRRPFSQYVINKDPNFVADQLAIIKRHTSYYEFMSMIDVYQGGYTHGNALYSNRILSNLVSVDFSSMYPSMMVLRTFPLTPFTTVVDESEINQIMSETDVQYGEYKWIAKVKFTNIKSIMDNVYFSISKAFVTNYVELEDGSVEEERLETEGAVIDNGRIVSADVMYCNLSDLDWDILRRSYSWESMEILNFKKSKSGYLPPAIVEFILKYFAKKTKHKNVKGEEDLLVESKQILNGLYGISVFKLLSDIIEYGVDKNIEEKYYNLISNNIYDGYNYDEDYIKYLDKKMKSERISWSKRQPTVDDFVETISEIKEGDNGDTVMSYQIGVWVAAWGRWSIWNYTILPADKYNVYNDTDSAKWNLPQDEAQKLIDTCNNEIKRLQEECSVRYNISIDMFRPRNNNGDFDSIGELDLEDHIVKFKTMGAKRYCRVITEKNKKTGETKDVFKYTISGLPAKCPMLTEINDFYDGLTIDTKSSGKKIAKYVSEDIDKTLIWQCDEDVIPHIEHKRFGVVIEPTTFNLSMSEDYRNYVNELMNYKNNSETIEKM